MTNVTVDLPPESSTCDGCVKAEPQIRDLLGLISNILLKNPTKFFGFELPKYEPVDCSELFDRWVKKFDSDPKTALCPDLKKRIEALVHELLNDKVPFSGHSRKRKAPDASSDKGLAETMESLRHLAVDPGAGADRDWRRRVLSARKALFLRMGDVADMQQFPYPKKHKRHKFLTATSGNTVRRSQRTLLKIGNSELPRKHIPIGPTFQADVPEWTGPPNEKDLSDYTDELSGSKWLGTQIWPIESDDRNSSNEIIGKGKEFSCECSDRGSVECVRLHVNQARLRLKSDLGLSVSSMGFDEMGEEVAESWTQEEQMRFDDIVRENCSEHKSFWEPLTEYFSSRTRKDIASFYFNVFLLRWMSIWTRRGTQPVYSSDDENSGW